MCLIRVNWYALRLYRWNPNGNNNSAFIWPQHLKTGRETLHFTYLLYYKLPITQNTTTVTHSSQVQVLSLLCVIAFQTSKNRAGLKETTRDNIITITSPSGSPFLAVNNNNQIRVVFWQERHSSHNSNSSNMLQNMMCALYWSFPTSPAIQQFLKKRRSRMNRTR